MSSRDSILAKVRRQRLPEAPLPGLDEPWIRFDDRQAKFVETLQSVGGQTLIAANRDDLLAQLRELPHVREAKRIVCDVAGGESFFPGATAGLSSSADSSDLAVAADPHALADVDVAIVSGDFAVAENAAVWVSSARLRHRAVLFLAQHLVLVVPRQSLVHNLHEAYERLTFSGQGYGVFISGPSKTADIEQSLVIGAHGPRSLTVALVDE